jgi:hypothetical protein
MPIRCPSRTSRPNARYLVTRLDDRGHSRRARQSFSVSPKRAAIDEKERLPIALDATPEGRPQQDRESFIQARAAVGDSGLDTDSMQSFGDKRCALGLPGNPRFAVDDGKAAVTHMIGSGLS